MSSEQHLVTLFTYVYTRSLQIKNPRSVKYGLDAIPYRASQLWQEVTIDTHEAASLALFKVTLGIENVRIVHVDLEKYSFKISGISD